MTPEDYAELRAELEAHPIPRNKDRYVAGAGRSQTFGLQRRWSYIPWLGRNTWMMPKLWTLLQEFAVKHFPDFEWDAITVNEDYQSKPHRDKGNAGPSITTTFGDFTGGELVIQDASGDHLIDTRHQLYRFNGAETLHWTASFVGKRYCLVFYKIIWSPKYSPFTVRTSLEPDGLRVQCGYTGEDVVLNKRGKVVRTIKAAEPRLYKTRIERAGGPAINNEFAAAVETASPVSPLSESS